MWSSLLHAGRYLGNGLLDLFYPRVCSVCGELPEENEVWPHPICPSCCTQLTHKPYQTCPRCASPVGLYANVQGGCSRCRGQALGFERAFAMGGYDSVLRSVVLLIKHRSNEMLTEQMGALWARHCAAELTALGGEVVVPIPLHWWRRLRRGYNQSETLARQLASALRLPLMPGCLRRIRNTPFQSQLMSLNQKKENVKGAFEARQSETFKGRTVLLVDDVMTTGSTAGEAARTLKKAGAKAVVVAALARAAS